jgi:hypothetical protein
VLAYLIDTGIASGSGPIRVLPINDFDSVKGNVALQLGQNVASGGVTISFISQDANGDRVRIVR